MPPIGHKLTKKTPHSKRQVQVRDETPLEEAISGLLDVVNSGPYESDDGDLYWMDWQDELGEKVRLVEYLRRIEQVNGVCIRPAKV